MNDPATVYGYQRSQTRSRFLTRCYRYRVLLRNKWWIPATTIGLGLSIAASLVALHPPSFRSYGRMIVSIKLALPEGSVYAEEMGGLPKQLSFNWF